MGRVQDRVVIVTGGAGGIGAAACRAIATEGGKVVVADLDAAAAQAVADEITSNGGSAASAGVDVTDRSQVQAMIQKAVETFGELNVIFNNAGMNRPRGFMDVDEENFESIVRVNTWGVIVCTQEAAKQMIAQGAGGKIINTGSIASRQGFWDFVPTASRSSARSPSPRRPPAASSSTGSPSTRSLPASSTLRCGSASTTTYERFMPSRQKRTRCASSRQGRSWGAPRHPRS